MGLLDDMPGLDGNGKPIKKGLLDDMPVPGATVGGAFKNLAAAAIEGTGSAIQGGLEIGAKGLNSALGTEKYSGFNPLKSYADSIKAGLSVGDQAAIQDANRVANIDIMKPDTYQLPQTVGGYAHTVAQGLGSTVPTLATALLTRGRGGVPAMAAQGGLMTGGAAAGDVRENIGKLNDDQLGAQSPAFKALLDGGMSALDARQKIANESAQYAGIGSGALGALGGAFNARLLDDIIAKKGIPALLGQQFAGRPLARIATGAAIGAVGEGAQEVAEKIGQNAGENIGMGKAYDDNLTRDTFGDFIGGALVGKVTGGIGGAFSKPGVVATPDGKPIDPEAGPISRAAATAINTGVAQGKADQKTAEAAQQQVEAEQSAAKEERDAQAKAFAGKPEHDDPVKWFSALNGSGQTALIQKLDGDERQTAVELIQTARNPEASEPIRAKASAQLFEIAQRTGLPGVTQPVAADATPAPKKDATAIANDNIAQWSASHDPFTLQEATLLQRTAAKNGEPVSVVPHGSGTGFTVIPNQYVGERPSTGQLPAPTQNTEKRNNFDVKPLFPFKDQTQAVNRADATSKQLGEEYTAIEHPTVNGAFAVVPQREAAAPEKAPWYSPPVLANPDAVKRLPAPEGVRETNNAPQLNDLSENAKTVSSQQQLSAKTSTAQGTAPNSSVTQQAAQNGAITNASALSAQKLLPAPTSAIDEAAHAAATSPLNALPEPTPAQQDAGNYAKGHVKIGGLDISIENPSGSTRTGTTADGKPWARQMRDHYGYVRGSVGADKGQVDVFIKNGTKPEHDGSVFVVDQVNPKTGAFDEHKALIGYSNIMQAQAAYKAHYEKGWKGMGQITPMPMDQFKTWVKSPEVQNPLVVKDRQVSSNLMPGEQAQTSEPANQQVNPQPETQSEVAPQSAADPLTKVPKLFVMKHEVDARSYDADADKYETTKAPAQEALDANQRDIETLEALRKCVGAG